MWGRNIRVVIIPSILAFIFFGLSIYLDLLADLQVDLFPLVVWIGEGALGGEFLGRDQIDGTAWGNDLVLTGLTASMTVNAVVTGLIVFRIFKVFRETKGITTSNEKSLGINGGRKFRSLIFVIIESGMALFAIQLTRVVVTTGAFGTTEQQTAASDNVNLIASIHEMLNVNILSVIATFCFN